MREHLSGRRTLCPGLQYGPALRPLVVWQRDPRASQSFHRNVSVAASDQRPEEARSTSPTRVPPDTAGRLRQTGRWEPCVLAQAGLGASVTAMATRHGSPKLLRSPSTEPPYRVFRSVRGAAGSLDDETSRRSAGAGVVDFVEWIEPPDATCKYRRLPSVPQAKARRSRFSSASRIGHGTEMVGLPVGRDSSRWREPTRDGESWELVSE
jgi:hypothetical protein